MKNIATKILEDTKTAYKESIIIDNKIIEDKLLSIMANTKYLLNELETVKLKKKKKKPQEDAQSFEIEKVKRKVPLWLKKTNQYNYKILNTFMSLSNNNNHTINVTTLEAHCNINDPKKFLSNYNLLKTISEKNHGKVFVEKDGQVSLWKPVEEIVVSYFK